MASSLQWTGKCCWQSAGANMECISSTKHSEQRNIKKHKETGTFRIRSIRMHSYAFVLCHSTCIICHIGVTTFDCSIRAAWVVPPVYPDSCLDASVAVRTCTAITDLKQTPSQQSLDQMCSYHFRYHTSSGYSLHWFRFKWSLHQIKWFYLLLLHPDTFKVPTRRSWKSLRFAVPQSLFPFCHFHALPAARETFWFHHVTMWSSSKQHRTQSNLGKTWKNKNRKTLDLQKYAKGSNSQQHIFCVLRSLVDHGFHLLQTNEQASFTTEIGSSLVILWCLFETHGERAGILSRKITVQHEQLIQQQKEEHNETQ